MLKKSNHCIDTARKAYDLLQQKKAKKAEVITGHLEALIEDGKYLQESTKCFLKKLQSQEEDLDETLEQLQMEKGNLETEKGELLEKKASLESNLSSKSSILEDNDTRLKEAEKERKDAENELYRAKKKKKKGGIFKKAKRLVGLVDGAKKRVDRAKRNLARLDSELKVAQNAACSAKQAVAAVQTQIQQQDGKILAVQQQIDEKHAEIGSTKNSVVLLRKSASFWSFFVVAAENAEERTANLKQFVDQAAEKKDYELLREDGTVTKADSFLAAWAMVANDHRIQEE